MNTKMVIGVVVAAVVLIGGVIFFTQSSNTKTPTETETVQSNSDAIIEEKSEASDTSMMEEDELSANEVEVNVVSEGLVFNPKEIKVKKGQTVVLTYKNTKGTHDFVIDEFSVKTKRLNANEEETVEFVADKAGEFEYYCSVPGHKAAGMKGVLIVE